MIEHILTLGKYVKDSKETDIVDFLVNTINSDSIREILNVNIINGQVETFTEEFYSDISKKALFFQAGNAMKGGGLRLDFYKQDSKEQEKFNKKISKVCEYCGVSEYYEKVKEAVYYYINSRGINAFAVLLIDSQYPNQVIREKFIADMYSQIYKQVKQKDTCHLCGTYEVVYNSVVYRFYTNDKDVYTNVNHPEKSGIVICRDCLDAVIIGKKQVEELLTTYWLGKSVMFLPHEYNEEIESIYDYKRIDDVEGKKLVDRISSNEEEVLEEIGKTKGFVDIIFFEKDGNKTFYLYHHIKSILPSRFTILSQLLNKYNLTFFTLLRYATNIKVTLQYIDTSSKEKIKIMDAVFSGKRIHRHEFFGRVLKVYKHDFYQKENKYASSMTLIHRVYNFLVDCGCLEGGWSVDKSYSSYDELFSENGSYFNSNEKKAWFLVGRLYNTVNYYMKKSLNSAEKNEFEQRTSLDKNFFFARKFDFTDFIYFSNLLDEKMDKYRIRNRILNSMLSEAKELMGKREKQLSFDEAKYVFFWGRSAFFKEEKEEVNKEEEK